MIVLIFILSGIGLIGSSCLVMAIQAGPSDDKGKWAMSVLGMIVSAGIGYLGGKAQSR